jgi:hypothetical protein
LRLRRASLGAGLLILFPIWAAPPGVHALEYLDNKNLAQQLQTAAESHVRLVHLKQAAETLKKNPVWLVELGQGTDEERKRRPALLLVAGLEGNDLAGAASALFWLQQLLQDHATNGPATRLLDSTTIYIFPRLNPDAAETYFTRPKHESLVSRKPVDDDHDGLVDEDDVDDLNDDESITQMRIKDPNGRWKPHPQHPGFLMVQAAADEMGEYTLLGWEGIDNDGDGEVNEDPVGGYDTNRNWAWDWQPNYIQFGAQDYPFSLPESRSISEFVISRPNIAAFQSYHNFGGMILRNPGREGGVAQADDC